MVGYHRGVKHTYERILSSGGFGELLNGDFSGFGNGIEDFELDKSANCYQLCNLLISVFIFISNWGLDNGDESNSPTFRPW